MNELIDIVLLIGIFIIPAKANKLVVIGLGFWVLLDFLHRHGLLLIPTHFF